jgi:hypothetical protein
VALSGDAELSELLDEVSAYSTAGEEDTSAAATGVGNVLTPVMRMRPPGGEEMSFFFSVATFGTAIEVTASELSIELGFPADLATVEALRKLPRR